MSACCNYSVPYSLSNMYFEHNRLSEYITSKRNTLPSPHITDNEKMLAGIITLKRLAMPEEQSVTLSSLSLLRGPALKIQCHPPSIHYEDQTPGENSASTCFPL